MWNTRTLLLYFCAKCRYIARLSVSNMDTVETGFLSVRITAPGEYSVQFEPCIQHGGRTTLMEDAEGAALLQYLRALSPGVRIYADGTLELEQPEL